jgi:N-acetylglucosaminyldiphosphoundecaprenol N-acetyl-beta-D-mannosaminyltransferase
MRVDAGTYASMADRIVEWGSHNESRYVCVANVHMVMETVDSTEFRSVVNGADLVTSDGVPLVWALRALGIRDAERVYGPSLVLEICARAEQRGISIALYGGTPDRLEAFKGVLARAYPRLVVAAAIAPPFRPLTPEEDRDHTAQLAASGAGITFVGIGCPKQERWMAAHRGRIPTTMVGVGAAFDFHSGAVRQAPPVLQRLGLEWLFRLVMEPRRLWKRYLKHNPRFVLQFARQLLGGPASSDAAREASA